MPGGAAALSGNGYDVEEVVDKLCVKGKIITRRRFCWKRRLTTSSDLNPQLFFAPAPDEHRVWFAYRHAEYTAATGAID